MNLILGGSLMMLLGLSAFVVGTYEIFNSKVDVHYEYWKQYGREQVIRSIEMDADAWENSNATTNILTYSQFLRETARQLKIKKGWPQ